MKQESDRALTEAVLRRRDERAFSELYARHTPAMYGLALRLCAGSGADAEDIVHDAWLRAVDRLATFEWRSALSTWLCGFVVYRWRELHRRDRRMVHVAIDDDAMAAHDDVLELSGDRVDLERAVHRLADGYREVLVLHDIEGFTHEEIGALLGIETGTSKSQLARARRAMRRELAEPKEGASP